MSFVGGKLRLKGGVEVTKSGIKKKKKKAAAAEQALAQEAADAALASKELEHAVVDGAGDADKATDVEVEDRRTEAEKRHDARVAKLEEERVRKAAAKSHRERIKELNEKLSTLTEHHDIPRVSYSCM